MVQPLLKQWIWAGGTRVRRPPRGILATPALQRPSGLSTQKEEEQPADLFPQIGLALYKDAPRPRWFSQTDDSVLIFRVT